MTVQSIHAGGRAPDFEATTLDGKPFKLSELRGKVVLLDFWAAWCGPCVAELPHVKELYEKYGGDNFVVVGVSFDRDAATARKFVNERQLGWTQIWAEKADNGPIARQYGVGGIPATFLIAADGKVIERDLRGEALAKSVAQEVRKLAAGGAPQGDSFVAGLLRSAFKAAIAAPTAPLPDESPEARAVLDATVARYRALQSYRDGFHYAARLERKGESPVDGQIDGTLAWTAGRIASKSDLMHVYCDGHKATRYWPSAHRYMTQDSAGDLSDALRAPEWDPFGQPGAGVHPLAALLAAGDEAAAMLPIVVVTGVQPTTRDGRPGQLLSGRFRVDGLSHGEAVPFDAFIDDQRKLFEDFRLDYTAGHRAALRESYEGDPNAVERAEIVITLRDVECNGPIEDAAFVLNEPGARDFSPYVGGAAAPAARPEKLVGQAAPALTGTAFDGSQFDLAAERGKVVVVAFWGTWAPQADLVLRELQRLAAARTPNVCFVGVSRNGAPGEAAARQRIERAGVQFPQVSDADGELGKAWNVACLPLVYVVGPDGHVGETFQSWTDDTPQALSDCVLRLVNGKSADSGDAPPKPTPRDGPGGLVLKTDSEPVGDARVTSAASENVNGSQWNMSEQDVDGDGETELVFPDWQGGLTIVKPSTGAVQHLSLPGLEGAAVQSARAVRIDGETCWLCSGARYDPFGGGSQGRTLLCLYSPRGELLWTFQPEVHKDLEAQAQAVAGDLDGDGRVEYVIGLSMYRREKTDENNYTLTDMSGRLIWLDHAGRRIAERELGNQVELLYVTTPPPDRPATLLCFSGGQMERYSLAPEPHGE